MMGKQSRLRMTGLTEVERVERGKRRKQQRIEEARKRVNTLFNMWLRRMMTGR